MSAFEEEGIAAVVADLVSVGFDATGAEIWVRSGFQCEYCGADLLASPQIYGLAEADHILPQCKYPRLTDDLNNYAHTCGLCNKLKRNWDPGEGEPALRELDSLSANQRQQFIERCRSHLKEILAKETKKMAEVEAVLRQHGLRPLRRQT